MSRVLQTMMRIDTRRCASFLQTGVLHRFFCPGILGAVLLSPGLQAQIPLEEMPLPSKEESLPVAEPGEVSEKEVEAVIKRIGGVNARVPSKNSVKKVPDEKARLLMERKKAFENLPEKIEVIIDREGEKPLSGITMGQGFRVENAAGTFPVLLHELDEIQVVNAAEGIFELKFRSGDLLKGKLSLNELQVRLDDGETITVRSSDIKNLKMKVPSP